MQLKYFLKPALSVIYREIRIITRYRTWFVASFIWPIIFPLTLFFMGKGLAGTAGQGLGTFEQLAQTNDYASFLILGNLVWMFVNINLWMGGLSLQQDRVRGMFDTHWTLPVSKMSLVLGATVASIILNFIPMVAAIAFYTLIGAFVLTGNIFNIFLTIVLIMPFLMGFLILFSALTIRLRQANMVVMTTRTVLAIMCGLQFPLAVLPKALTKISMYIPLTHFIDIIRGVIIHKNTLAFHADSIRFIVISGIIMLIIGITIFNLVIRSVKKTGLVTGY